MGGEDEDLGDGAGGDREQRGWEQEEIAQTQTAEGNESTAHSNNNTYNVGGRDHKSEEGTALPTWFRETEVRCLVLHQHSFQSFNRPP